MCFLSCAKLSPMWLPQWIYVCHKGLHMASVDVPHSFLLPLQTSRKKYVASGGCSLGICPQQLDFHACCTQSVSRFSECWRWQPYRLRVLLQSVIIWKLNEYCDHHVCVCMKFTINDKYLIKWIWVKKLRRKMLARDVFNRRWSLDGINTLIKISVQDL